MNKLGKNCLICSKIFFAIKPSVLKKRKYCSYECSIKDRKSTKQIEVKCSICSKQFTDFTYRERRFCSLICAGKDWSINSKKAVVEIRKCFHCSKEFSKKHFREGKFCSRKCIDENQTFDKDKLWSSFVERFKIGYEIKESGCWEWTKFRTKTGYGRIYDHERNKMVASRASWLINKGPIPEGFFVLHKCDNPPCVNTDHLWLGTKQDNANDSVRKGRWKIDQRIKKMVETKTAMKEEVK